MLAARRKPASQTAHLFFLPTLNPTLKKQKSYFLPSLGIKVTLKKD